MTLRAPPSPVIGATAATQRGGAMAWVVSLGGHGALVAGALAIGLLSDSPPTPLITVDIVMVDGTPAAAKGVPSGETVSAAKDASPEKPTGDDAPAKRVASLPPPAPPAAPATQQARRVGPPDPTPEVKPQPVDAPRTVSETVPDVAPATQEARRADPPDPMPEVKPQPVDAPRAVSESVPEVAEKPDEVAAAITEPMETAEAVPMPRPRPATLIAAAAPIPIAAPPPRPKPAVPRTVQPVQHVAKPVEKTQPDPPRISKPNVVMLTDVGPEKTVAKQDTSLTLASAPAASAPARSRTEAVESGLSGAFSLPTLGRGLGNRPPRYPDIAREYGWEGRVILRVRVDSDGKTQGVSVKRSSGHDVLDGAALAAIRDWRFNPARRGGRAVPGVLDVPISFRLQN